MCFRKREGQGNLGDKYDLHNMCLVITQNLLGHQSDFVNVVALCNPARFFLVSFQCESSGKLISIADA